MNPSSMMLRDANPWLKLISADLKKKLLEDGKYWRRRYVAGVFLYLAPVILIGTISICLLFHFLKMIK